MILNIFWKFRQNFHQQSAENNKFSLNAENVLEFHFILTKNVRVFSETLRPERCKDIELL